MRKILHYTLVAAFALWVPAGWAQATAQAPDRLAEASTPRISVGGPRVTLERLLAHAARHAPALAVAAAEIDLADEERALAQPLLSDNAVLQAGVGPRIQRGGDRARAPNAQVQLLQPIEIGGQRSLRRDVARAAGRTRDRAFEQARWQVHQQLHAGYRTALAARRNAEIAQRLAMFSEGLVDVARRRVLTGDAARLVEQLAEADAAQARQRAAAALQAYRDACLSLAEVAGWSATSPPEPAGDLPVPRRAPTLDELTRFARAGNPELQVQGAFVEEAETRAALARRDAWPDPWIGFQYGFEGAPNGGPGEHVIMGMIQLGIPSFDLNQGEVARRTAQHRVARERRDALSSMLVVRLERLRSAVSAAAERVDAFGEHILPRFEENLTMLRRAFELGEIDLLRVSVALERFLGVQQQALEAHADYFSAIAALEAQVGQEIWPGLEEAQ
ncbi:MAG: hypothetical protein CMN30_28865 [Sandaracinus sp.]|nr:hypothetical protein [Sandaracinus sp.]